MGWLSAVISAAGSYLSDRSAAKDAAKAAKAANADEYLWSARLERYNSALADYYKQRDKGQMRNAAAEYGKFSSLDRWAPGYTNTNRPLQAPALPPTSANVADMSYYSGYTGGTNPGVAGPTGSTGTSQNNTQASTTGTSTPLGGLEQWLRGQQGGGP